MEQPAGCRLQRIHRTMCLPPAAPPPASCSLDSVRFPLRCGFWAAVACDLADPAWAEALLAAGFDPRKPTVWVAEGALLVAACAPAARCAAGRLHVEALLNLLDRKRMHRKCLRLAQLLPITLTVHGIPLFANSSGVPCWLFAGLLMYLEEGAVRSLLGQIAGGSWGRLPRSCRPLQALVGLSTEPSHTSLLLAVSA